MQTNLKSIYVWGIEKSMKSFGNGARAEVYVQWKNGGAHVFVAEQIGNATVFIAPQSGSTFPMKFQKNQQDDL